MRRAALLVLLCWAAPLAGQASGGCCGVHDWLTWEAGNPLRNHPQAHAIGGVALDLVARAPLFAPGIRRHWYTRLAAVAVMQGAREFWQLKETEGYPVSYAALDVGAAVVGAGLLELILPGRKR